MGASSMNQPVSLTSPALPVLVTAAGERASMRFLEFFAANIRNAHTRQAYALREKGGKRHAMPCHHNLAEYLTALEAHLKPPARRAPSV
jgi:hypothetical protein